MSDNQWSSDKALAVMTLAVFMCFALLSWSHSWKEVKLAEYSRTNAPPQIQQIEQTLQSMDQRLRALEVGRQIEKGNP